MVVRVRHVSHNMPGTDDSEEMTLQQAAELLHVDRRYLVTLLETGVIPFTGRGHQRHVRRSEVLAYGERRDAERRAALRELTRLSEEYGLVDADYSALDPDRS